MLFSTVETEVVVTNLVRIIDTILVGVLVSGCAGGSAEDAIVEQARAIHGRVLTLDTHIDIPFNYATREVDPGVPNDFQVDLTKMRTGGLDAGFFVVYVGQTERTPSNEAEAKTGALTKFDAIHRMAEEMYPDEIEIAYSANDVERIASSGKLVAAIGIENGFVIGRDLSLLETYFDLGARYMTLAHGGHNAIADSATAGDVEPEHGGVSAFGEEVIAEMNRLGMMVDVSHISRVAMMDAVRLSEAPVIASHSSVRALMDHPRNLDDEQLVVLRDNGGVMQTVAMAPFLTEPAARRRREYMSIRRGFGMIPGQLPEELGAEPYEDYIGRMEALDRRFPDATVVDFVDHIEYAVELIGIDHVGISSDFDGGGGILGWNDARETLNVTVELVRRGYREEDIAKLWGGDLLRVFREVEAVAARLQGSQVHGTGRGMASIETSCVLVARNLFKQVCHVFRRELRCTDLQGPNSKATFGSDVTCEDRVSTFDTGSGSVKVVEDWSISIHRDALDLSVPASTTRWMNLVDAMTVLVNPTG